MFCLWSDRCVQILISLNQLSTLKIILLNHMTYSECRESGCISNCLGSFNLYVRGCISMDSCYFLVYFLGEGGITFQKKNVVM